MPALHSKKTEAEKNAFIAELYGSLPTVEAFTTGELKAKAQVLHETLLPAYILKHFVPRQFQSEYLDVIFTNLIESESLLLLGFRNAGVCALRGGVESSFKFLYYEYHPIELSLHALGEHSLTGSGYRSFMYSFPGLKSLHHLKQEHVEALWSNLCRYVHCDLRAISTMSIVADIRSALADSEKHFQSTLELVKKSTAVIVSMLLAVEPRWMESMEADYFDAVLETFPPEHRKEILATLNVV